MTSCDTVRESFLFYSNVYFFQGSIFLSNSRPCIYLSLLAYLPDLNTSSRSVQAFYTNAIYFFTETDILFKVGRCAAMRIVSVQFEYRLDFALINRIAFVSISPDRSPITPLRWRSDSIYDRWTANGSIDDQIDVVTTRDQLLASENLIQLMTRNSTTS